MVPILKIRPEHDTATLFKNGIEVGSCKKSIFEVYLSYLYMNFMKLNSIFILNTKKLI